MHWDNPGRERPNRFTEDQSCWELFGAAIIRQALVDYKMGSVRRRQEVERFIRSDYFNSISDIDQRWLLKHIKLLIPRSIEHV